MWYQLIIFWCFFYTQISKEISSPIDWFSLGLNENSEVAYCSEPPCRYTARAEVGRRTLTGSGQRLTYLGPQEATVGQAVDGRARKWSGFANLIELTLRLEWAATKGCPTETHVQESARWNITNDIVVESRRFNTNQFFRLMSVWFDATEKSNG